MNDLVEFLTSQEILFVYLISAFACIVSLIVYITQKKSEVARRRHNTKELNKLVEEIKERVPEKTSVVSEPVIQRVENVEPEIEVLDPVNEVILSAIELKEEEKQAEEEQFEYTSIEPDQETARLELEKLKEELKVQEEKERQEQEQLAIEEAKEEVINIDEYEDNQEATAIISVEELLEKSKDLYSNNEAMQYENDNNQPISIQDLEKQMARSVTQYNEPFIIEEVVVEDNANDDLVPVVSEEVINTNVNIEPVVQSVSVREETIHEEKKFKSSPIISPIFGIERNPSEDNSLALENTANYEKLDEQIKKSNEYSMTLNEFQKNL